MTDTANLALPFIDGSQAQKHVTHNEALRILDAAVQIGVADLNLTAPPLAPTAGERHVVASGATGAWAGQAKMIATWEDGAWRFLAAKPGWLVWSAADNNVFVFDGANWSVVSGGGGGSPSFDNLPHVGINSTASSPNLLSVKSNAALFNSINIADGGTGDARVQISKESSAKTASVFFSDAFSGRAEFGLVGSDDFKLKVSSDGTTFVEAFNIDKTSGNLALPRGLSLGGVISPAQITANQNDYNPAGIASASVLQISSDASRTISGLAGGGEGRIVCVLNVGSQSITLLDESGSSSAANRFTLGGNLVIAPKQASILRYDGAASRWFAVTRTGGVSSGREVLTANRTYYVRTDGSDSNNGLANTSGGAFLTVQAAWNAILKIDLNGYAITLQIGDGTYTGGLSITSAPIGGIVTINGNATTPTNVVISNASPVNVNGVGINVIIQNMRLTTSGSAGLTVIGLSSVNFGPGMSFTGTPTQAHIWITQGATLSNNGNGIAIASSGAAWIAAQIGALANLYAATFTFSGTPAWSNCGLDVSGGAVIQIASISMSGSATGKRYAATTNGAIITFGAGTASTYFPGNSNGTTATGGQQG